MKKFLFVLMTAALALPMMAQGAYKMVPADRNSMKEVKTTSMKALDLSARPTVEMNRADKVLYAWDFETEDQLAEWSTYDADGDGYGWEIFDGTQAYSNYAHSGYTALLSRSYKSGALDPDNWIFSPDITLDGTLTLWAMNVLSSFPDRIAVYVCVGDFDLNNFVKVSDDFLPGGSYEKFTVDLTQFAGQTGCFAIRHYDSYDMYQIVVDDITITAPAVSAPVNVTADPAATTANIAWEDPNNNNWNVRWRVYTPQNYYFWDFEDGMGDWTTIDADGDGNVWYVYDPISLDGNPTPETMVGNKCMTSESYINYVGPQTPDNWLVSPKVVLSGELSFLVAGQDPDYAAEVFGVYVSTDKENWEPLAEGLVAEYPLRECTFDLSAYEGQEGYVAIRHYDITDMFRLNVDNVRIGTEVPEEEWFYYDGATEPNFTIEGLNPETTYEVQVQAVNGEDQSDWTPSVIFTTLASGDEPTDQCAKPEGGFENGVDFHGVMVTLINNETAEGTELHYNITKDGELIIEDAIYDEAFALTEDGEYYIDFWATAPGMLDSSHGGLIFTIDAFTGLSELLEGKTVAAVRYFNVAGQEIAQPEGLTIVVTTYTDGTTNAAKVVK